MNMEPQVPASDAERIAKVTYLFGIAPDAPEPAASTTEAVGRVDAPASYGDQPPTETKSSRPENVSMHALTRRGMSVAEMTTLLERREIDPDDVAAEVERLESVGLLDDAALAENLVRTLQQRKGLGRSAVSAELRRRKVDPLAIEEALGSIDTDDELTRAIEVATKRAGQLRSYDAETAKRRLGAYLQRRGYSGSVLSAAMTAALAPGSDRDGGGPRFR
jgi:regulatory protein